MSELRKDAFKDLVENEGRPSDGPAGGERRLEEKQIIKEGLSEYFIYTVEGTETVPNGWSKRMRSLKEVTVPLKIQYRYRLPEYGDQLVRMYLLTNDKPSNLGTTPLPDGMVRIFRDNGRNGLSFLSSQNIKYIPIGEKIELNLGPDRNVIFELRKLRAWRDEIWMHIHGAQIFRRVGDGAGRIDVDSTVAGWNEHEIFAQRIRNYTPKPLDVEIRRAFPGHIRFRSRLDAIQHDFQTVQITTAVDPGSTKDLLYEIIRHRGRNVQQNNVTIEKADVTP